MKNITVGESRLKGVVPEVKEVNSNDQYYIQSEIVVYNQAIEETLSTPLPPVEDCVEIDVEKLRVVIINNASYFKKDWIITPTDLAKAIANSKSILKWKKGEK